MNAFVKVKSRSTKKEQILSVDLWQKIKSNNRANFYIILEWIREPPEVTALKDQKGKT